MQPICPSFVYSSESDEFIVVDSGPRHSLQSSYTGSSNPPDSGPPTIRAGDTSDTKSVMSGGLKMIKSAVTANLFPNTNCKNTKQFLDLITGVGQSAGGWVG